VDQGPIELPPATRQNWNVDMGTASIAVTTSEVEQQKITPPVPETAEEVGLPSAALEHLILKLLYARGEMLGRDLSQAMGLKFSLVEDYLEYLKRQYLIQAKTSMGMGSSTTLFALTETGRNLARECMEKNQYTGPAPVPLFQYTYIVRRQRQQEGWLTKEALAHAVSISSGGTPVFLMAEEETYTFE